MLSLVVLAACVEPAAIERAGPATSPTGLTLTETGTDTDLPPVVGAPATDFTIQGHDGNLITLSDYRGDVILIDMVGFD